MTFLASIKLLNVGFLFPCLPPSFHKGQNKLDVADQ